MLLSRDAVLTALHGIVLGGLFLLAYSGGLLGLYSLRPGWVTVTGFRGIIRRLTARTWLMAGRGSVCKAIGDMSPFYWAEDTSVNWSPTGTMV